MTVPLWGHQLTPGNYGFAGSQSQREKWSNQLPIERHVCWSKLLFPLTLKQGGVLSTKVHKRLHRDSSLVNVGLSCKYIEMNDDD